MDATLLKLIEEIARAHYKGRWLMIADDSNGYLILFGKVSGDALEQWWRCPPSKKAATPDDAARNAINHATWMWPEPECCPALGA